MKVFVVMSYPGDETQFHGVFRTHEAAERFIHETCEKNYAKYPHLRMSRWRTQYDIQEEEVQD